MSAKNETLNIVRETSRNAALYLQSKAPDMSGTELYAKGDYVPDFSAVITAGNMIDRKAGFVCKSSAGRIVVLIQPYNSAIYTGEPETLSAQWGFKWSTDPAKALPFIALSTSPYMTGDCCIDGGKVYRSKQDNNVWAPSDYAQAWEEV